MIENIPLSAKTWIDGGDGRRLAHAARSIKFHVSFLDDIAIGLLPTDLVVIGAATGAGKTTLGANIACDAAHAGQRVVYLALEAHQGEIEQRLIYRQMSAMAWDRNFTGRGEISYAHWVHGRCEDLTEAYGAEARSIMSKRLKTLSTFYRKAKFGVRDLIEVIGQCRDNTDLIVLDHLHFVDNDDGDENRGMKSIVKSISDAVRDVETPVIAIAHLRKKDSKMPRLVPDIDDFHGASDIVKIATKAIVLAPARGVDRVPMVAPTYMRVAKDRLVGETGLTALINFDFRTNNYHPRYELGKISGAEFTRLQISELPFWAKGARF